MKRTLADKLNHAVEDLRGLRDEIRLNVHLAGMDARDGMKDLGQRLEKAEHSLRDSLTRLWPQR